MFTVHILPDLANMLPQLIATLILFLVMKKMVTQPLKEYLDKRAETVAADLTAAEKEKQEAEQLKVQYEQSLENAKEEARGIVDSAKQRGEQLRSEIVSEAKQEAQVISERATNEIEMEKEKALDSLKSEVASMAMLIAGKVVDKNLDENTHKSMIDKFISEVGESKWQN